MDKPVTVTSAAQCRRQKLMNGQPSQHESVGAPPRLSVTGISHQSCLYGSFKRWNQSEKGVRVKMFEILQEENHLIYFIQSEHFSQRNASLTRDSNV